MTDKKAVPAPGVDPHILDLAIEAAADAVHAIADENEVDYDAQVVACARDTAIAVLEALMSNDEGCTATEALDRALS